MFKQPTFNGYTLPGYNAMLPLNKNFRWMIVWDKEGWTAPVRRIVVNYYGKFLDSDGNEWDCASELPEELTTDEFSKWNEVPDHVLMHDVDQWISAQFKKMPPLGQLFEEAEKAKGNVH